MTTKADMQTMIDKLNALAQQAEKARDEARAEAARYSKNYEGALKDVQQARDEARLASENLARALGYIDRINDQEPARTVPQEQPYPQARVELPRGPQLRSGCSEKSMYDQLRGYR